MTFLILQVVDTASCGKRPQDWVGPRSGLGITMKKRTHLTPGIKF